jgi:hypothetical protein
MKCRWVDDYTEFCTKSTCSACAGICPVPDCAELCIYWEDETDGESED